MNSHYLTCEYEPQDAIIIVWPHAFSDWALNLDAIEKTYLEICRCVYRQQHLILVAHDHAHLLHTQRVLERAYINIENITFLIIPTNDTWVRDYGPVYVSSDTQFVLLDFEFDAWGKKYAHALNNAFNSRLHEQLNANAGRQRVKQVIEAGNIEINRRGLLLCTNACFIRETGSLAIDFAQLEKHFSDWFGCSNTFWINNVQLIGDDTDGHIDTLARFCADDILVYSFIGNTHDANNAALCALATQLEVMKKQCGNQIDLVPLPLPDPIFSNGRQLPACYTNFLITNKCILVPIFNDKQDTIALRLLDELFPTREVLAVQSNILIQQLGGLHCATMHIPEGIIS